MDEDIIQEPNDYERDILEADLEGQEEDTEEVSILTEFGY